MYIGAPRSCIAHGHHKRVSAPLELSYEWLLAAIWMLGIPLGSSAWADRELSLQANMPALLHIHFINSECVLRNGWCCIKVELKG